MSKSTSLALADPLPALVHAKYAAAQAGGALTYASSELALVRIGSGASSSVFQLRFCPSLAKKPEPLKDQDKDAAHEHKATEKKKKPFDPFADPDPALYIADVPVSGEYATHRLVLNKFPIIPNHFILATVANKPQTHPLEQDDLALTHALLREWDSSASPSTSSDEGEDTLFAFFNSGSASGASQPHRHVQFLPVLDMRHGMPSSSPSSSAGPASEWMPLSALAVSRVARTAPPHRVISLCRDSGLPFAGFGAALSLDVAPEKLHEVYTALLREARGAVEAHAATLGAKAAAVFASASGESNGDVPFSYNMALTSRTIVLAPRIADGVSVQRGEGDGGGEGYVALNGTVLAGTGMVKDEGLWRVLKDGKGLEDVLVGVGVPFAGVD